MQQRTLSSASTFWMKFVFPPVWILSFGIVAILLSFGGLNDRSNAMPSSQMKFAFLGAWILGTTLILWTSAGLKRVRIDDRQLYVSNYIREISVPFSHFFPVGLTNTVEPRR